MSKFLPRVQSLCILVLMCFLTVSTDVFAQNSHSSNFTNNDIDNEPLFGQSLVNYDQQPQIVQSYSNNNAYSPVRRSRKVTLDCLPGDPGCEIDDPIDSHILLLIAFALLSSVYYLNKKPLIKQKYLVS